MATVIQRVDDQIHVRGLVERRVRQYSRALSGRCTDAQMAASRPGTVEHPPCHVVGVFGQAGSGWFLNDFQNLSRTPVIPIPPLAILPGPGPFPGRAPGAQGRRSSSARPAPITPARGPHTWPDRGLRRRFGPDRPEGDQQGRPGDGPEPPDVLTEKRDIHLPVKRNRGVLRHPEGR